MPPRAKLAKAEYVRQKKERALQARQRQEAAQLQERQRLVADVAANLEVWQAEARDLQRRAQLKGVLLANPGREWISEANCPQFTFPPVCLWV